MRRFTLVVLSFVLFGSLVFEVYGQKGPRIVNDFGERSVKKADFQARKSKGRVARKSTPSHAYLTLQRAPTKAIMEQIEKVGNLKINSLAQTHKDENKKYFVYLVRCHAGIEHSLDLLAESRLEHIVYGISPVENNDKVTRKIFENRGFEKGEKSEGNKIFALVRFYPDFDRNTADSLILMYCDSIIETSKNRSHFVVTAESHKLLKLSRHKGVMSVREYKMYHEPLIQEGRALIGVDSVQRFNLQSISFPPDTTSYWRPYTALTGEGITVGVYDTGIDSTRLDFREWNSQSGDLYNSGMSFGTILNNTALRGYRSIGRRGWYMSSPYRGSTFHGTHVASIIGGNGWETTNSPEKFGYRGIAPKVKFFADEMVHRSERYTHISNHSHTLGDQLYYGAAEAELDNNIYNNRKIVVVGAGNSGLLGHQKGYYSMANNAKNCITVGATYSIMIHEGRPLRAERSSMGPTRDGRIKPDVMAPGYSHRLPLINNEHPMIVWLDSVAIIGESGDLKARWGFQNGTMGWGGSHLWDPVSKIRNVTTVNSALRFEVFSFDDAYIWSDTISKFTANGTNPRCRQNDTLLLRYRIEIPPQQSVSVIDELGLEFFWRADSDNKLNGYYRGQTGEFPIPTNTGTEFTTVKICLGDLIGDWKNEYSDTGYHNNLVAMRIDFKGAARGGGILGAAPGAGNYVRAGGTSAAAPHVTGVLALMLEKYKRNYLNPVGLSVDTHAFWNSTAKALLIHTATDMIKETPYPFETPNPDTKAPIVYHKGPDYATGWGLVNAKKAIDYVDTTLFKQDSIDHTEVIIYKFNKTGLGDTRISLVWDDPAKTSFGAHSFSNATEPKLINNLDLHVIDPSGKKHLPWVLDPLPQPHQIFENQTDFLGLNGIDPIHPSDIKPARKGIDSLNNVEVVDIENAPSGVYTVVITATELGWPLQHFSLVADYPLVKDTTHNLGWRKEIREAKSGDVIVIPHGEYTLYGSHSVPDTALGVTLKIEAGTKLYLMSNAEIWVGSSGKIEGAENVLVSSQIIQYNTPEPREPQDGDNIIGLFGNLCDALSRGELGRTTKVGPGIYNFNHVGDEGLIGVVHQDRTKSSIIRMGFEDSAPGCGHIPQFREGSKTLIRNMRIEINGDHYAGQTVLTTYGSGIGVYENVIFDLHSSDGTGKNVTAIRLGLAGEGYPLTGNIEFRYCVFKGFETAVMVNDPMYREESPVFKETIFESNGTDLRFRTGSSAFCELEENRLNSVVVGDIRHTGTAINTLKSSHCVPVGITTRANLPVADPGLVDPFISDFRLTGTSPLIAAGTDLNDVGAQSSNAVFTFSRFLDGRVDFGNGQMVRFENGKLTFNNLGNAVEFRAASTLNLRPVYELRFKGGLARRPSEVTTWIKNGAAVPPLPDGYLVWDAAANGVQTAKLHRIELPASGSVTRRAVPDVIAPAPVSGINIVEESGDVVLKWRRNREPDMARYKIFRAPVTEPHRTVQIASLPAHLIEYRDKGRNKNANVYTIVAYDSTGNMSSQANNSSKVYNFTGFDASRRDTLRVTPAGVTVQIHNPNYQHGAMITVRNRGHNDSLVVEWYGSTDQNNSGCMEQKRNLFGNGAQINNFVSPKLGNGTVLVNIRSVTNKSYLVDIEIFNWRNGLGCLGYTVTPPNNPSGNTGGQTGNSNKIYNFSGSNASKKDTLKVTPAGVTVQIQNLDYLHGALITVRNKGHKDSIIVNWYGVTDQNQTGCQNHSRNLFGNGAQINNIASPKTGNGTVHVNIRSATKESYLADIEIFNWRNGRGCQ